MKRILSLILCIALTAGLLAGCGIDPGVTTPTGDALVLEGQDPASIGPQQEVVIQEFSMCYYPDRSMNPLTCRCSWHTRKRHGQFGGYPDRW